MINKEKATKIIYDVLLKMEVETGLKLEINYRYYEEFIDFMIFSYNSSEYLKTHNSSYLLAGNLPLIVDKIHGNVYKLLNSECELENYTLNQLVEDGFIEVYDVKGK